MKRIIAVLAISVFTLGMAQETPKKSCCAAKDKKELKTEYGVKIKSITSGKLKSLGLTEGMVITKVNNEPIKSIEQLTEKLNKVNTGVLLEVLTQSGRKEYIGFGI